MITLFVWSLVNDYQDSASQTLNLSSYVRHGADVRHYALATLGPTRYNDIRAPSFYTLIRPSPNSQDRDGYSIYPELVPGVAVVATRWVGNVRKNVGG